MNLTQLLLGLTILSWLVLIAVLISRQPSSESIGEGKVAQPAKKQKVEVSNSGSTVVKPTSFINSVPIDSKDTKREVRQSEPAKPVTSFIGSARTTPIIQTKHTNSASTKPRTDIVDVLSFKTASDSGVSWSDFLEQPSEPLTGSNAFPTNIKGLLTCPAEMVNRLAQRLPEKDLKWCQWALSDTGGRVKVGKSYGSLNSPDRNKYEQLNCNAVAKGKNPSCDDAWGDNQITSWRRNIMADMCGDNKHFSSKITCRESPNLAKVCIFDNIILDFSKMFDVKRPGRSDSRRWENGFITSHCNANKYPDINYYQFYKPEIDFTQQKCSFVLNETVVIYGHDDAKNLGHSMSDFMNVWAMLWLSGFTKHAKDIVFLNTDAIRMGHNYYDEMGQLGGHYRHQFKALLKASDFAKQGRPKVCVKRLLVQPQPVILFTWDGWWQDMKCSFVGPSSLFQRFNVQVRRAYGLLPFDNQNRSIAAVDLNMTRILLVKRVVGGSGSAPMYQSRVMTNINHVAESLLLIPHVTVVVQDLAVLTFEQQVSLISNSDFVIGVHGAGIPNAMHMPIGSSAKCCGVIEIFPQGEFKPIRGYGNMARRMGLHYSRMELSGSESSGHGCSVSPVALKDMVVGMMSEIATQPSCILPSVLEDPYFDQSVPISGI